MQVSAFLRLCSSHTKNVFTISCFACALASCSKQAVYFFLRCLFGLATFIPPFHTMDVSKSYTHTSPEFLHATWYITAKPQHELTMFVVLFQEFSFFSSFPVAIIPGPLTELGLQCSNC
jgi:hypothetical protein